MSACCIYHPAVRNRKQRKFADRYCPCRGGCGGHPEKQVPYRKTDADKRGKP